MVPVRSEITRANVVDFYRVGAHGAVFDRETKVCIGWVRNASESVPVRSQRSIGLRFFWLALESQGCPMNGEHKTRRDAILALHQSSLGKARA